MSMADYMEAALADVFQGTTFPAPPANWHIALYLDDPTDADVGIEVTGSGYVRKSLAANTTNWQTVGGVLTNKIAFSFAAATGAWGTPMFCGLRDAGSGGNLWLHGPLTVIQPVISGDVMGCAIGELRIEFT